MEQVLQLDRGTIGLSDGPYRVQNARVAADLFHVNENFTVGSRHNHGREGHVLVCVL